MLLSLIPYQEEIQRKWRKLFNQNLHFIIFVLVVNCKKDMHFAYLTLILLSQVLPSMQFDAHLMVQNAFPHVKNGSSSRILCYPTNDNPTDFYLIRTDTGQGTDLPKYSDVRRLGAPTHTLAIIMEHQDGNSRFGTYTCKENTTDAEITTFKLADPDTAEVIATQSYFSKNVDETVTFRVTTRGQKLPLVWYHNGKVVSEWADQTTVVISPINATHAGVYECFYDGRRHLGLHALIQLIVRGCAAGKWGKDCQLDCPECYSGGLCHDTLGICICPVGFAGDSCEIACGKNSFGKDCKKKCDYESTGDEIEACAGYLFCSPHPVGCGCAAGFKGKLCIDDCTQGSYGPDCTQTCHCSDGSACDTITGTCSTGCEDGWSGNSCEIGSESTTGTYGFPVCQEQCNCLNDTLFDATSGECLLGCKDGWTGQNCSMCSSGLFGPDCDEICHCQKGNDFCDTVTGHCNGGCSAGYTGVDCQTMCSEDTYGPDCSLPCSCLNGGSCNIFNGSCTCLEDWYGTSCNETAPMVVSVEPLEVNKGAVVNLTCFIQTTNALTNYSISSVDVLLSDIEEMNETHYKVMAKTDINQTIVVNCTGTNIHGFDSQEFTLTSIDQPYLNSLPQVMNITDTAMTVQWTKWEYGTDGGGKLNDEIHYMVVLKAKTNEVKSEWITQAVSKELDHLIPDEEYDVYVVCRRLGIGGEGPTTGSVTARTHCQIPVVDGVLPINLTIIDYGNTYINLNWTNLPFTRGHCKNMTYKISWNANDVRTHGEMEILDLQDEVNITNLIAGINYEIEMTLYKDDVVIGNPATVVIETLPLTTDVVTSSIITTTIPTTMTTVNSTCDEGKYGSNCSEDCACPTNSTCNPIDRSCNCIYPLAGIFCNETAPTILSLHPLEVNTGAESVNLTCVIESNTPLDDVTIWSIDFPDTQSSIEELNDTNLFEATINTNITENITVNCTGTNAHGSTHQEFNLTLIDPPYLMQAPNVFNVTETEMDIEWSKWEYSTDGGGKLNDKIEYRVVMRWKIVADIQSDWYYHKWHKAHGSKIGNLKPDQEYEAVIQCRRPGVGGEGKFSLSTTFTTNCQIPTDNKTWPKELQITDYGSNFISIKWKTLLPKTLICKDIMYELIWAVDKTISNATIENSKNEYNLTNLQPDTNYQIEMRLMAKGQAVGQPATLSIYTNSSTNIIGPVLNITTTTVTAKDINLVWEKPLNVENVNVYMIRIELVETIGCSKGTYQFDVTNQHPNLTIPNLQPNSMYLISIKAVVLQDFGSIASINVTTNEDVPEASPTNLMQQTISETELSIKWSSVSCKLTNSPSWIYNYNISDLDHNVVLHNTTTDNHVVISSDIIEQNYTFAVRIESAVGWGPVSTLVLNKQTDEINQSVGPVSNIETIVLSPREITVSWDKPSTPKEIDSYHLRIELMEIIGCTNISERIIETDVVDMMTNISDLHPNSIYSVSVQALASKQWGSMSSVNVTTYADVPEGSPLNLIQKTVSDMEVQFEWDFVPCETINSLNWSYEYTVATEDKEIVFYNTTIDNYVILPMDSIEQNNTFVVRIVTDYGWGPHISLVVNKETIQTAEAVEPEQVYFPPPQHMKLAKATATTLEITWRKPITNQTLTGYKIHFNRISTNHHLLVGIISKTIEKETTSCVLQDLTPASVYEIEITAMYNGSQSEPERQHYHTLFVDYEEGIPPVLNVFLPPPRLAGFENGSLILTIYAATNANQVKAYQVIVVNEENNEIIDEKNLNDFYIASEQKKFYYITAELKVGDLSEGGYDLTLGDNKTYNGYHNIPLKTQNEYQFYVRAVGWNKETSDIIECIAEQPVGALSRVNDGDQSACEIMRISCVWFVIIIAGTIIICAILLVVSLAILRKERKAGTFEIKQSNECLDGKELRETIKRSSKSRTYSSTSYSSQKT